MKVLRNGLEISDSDIKVLQHDLLNIEDWINGAVTGKIAACKSRLLNEWTGRLIGDPSVIAIPANENELIDMIVNRPDYQNRFERDALNADLEA
jgi:hypothetical protein|tara:strand:+ start:192 stop:473 length:282 start_codon:yes stop_codon:yes gene_type:complete